MRFRTGTTRRNFARERARSSRAAAVVCLLCLCLLGVAACSGGSGSKADAPSPHRGGTLRVAVVGVPSLDPARSDQPAAALVAGMLSTPLVRVDPVSANPKPGIAARWSADPTQTRFTFALRTNARFSDGTPVTAADVVATLNRVRQPATRSPLASTLSIVRRVTAPNTTTVVIDLVRPLAVLPSLLAQPGLGILPRAEVAAPARLATTPVGSGPFRFVRRTRSTMEFVGVRPAAAKTSPPPWVDGVELVEYRTVAAAYAGYRAGRVDVAPVGRPESDDATRRREHIVSAPYLAVSFYALNLKAFKFLDARFRQAIVHALDAKTLVKVGYASTALVDDGLIPEGVGTRPTDACARRCDYDPATSRRLLKAAFPKGNVLPIAIDFDDDPTQRAVATEVRRELQAVGIPATIRPHPIDQYSQYLNLGQVELFRFGWVADYPSTEAFLGPPFSTGAKENVIGFKSAAFDAALRAAEREPDPARRAADYAKAEAAVLDAAAVAPVVQFETRRVVTSSVRSLTLDPFGAFDATKVWLAPAPKR
jgi:ABC-type transport system substrate-binding protein